MGSIWTVWGHKKALAVRIVEKAVMGNLDEWFWWLEWAPFMRLYEWKWIIHIVLFYSHLEAHKMLLLKLWNILKVSFAQIDAGKDAVYCT